MLEYLIAVIVILCGIHVLLNYNSRARALNKIPGPKLLFIVGNALDIIISPVDLWKLGRKYAEEYKNLGFYRFWAYPFGAVNIYNPEDVETLVSSMKHIEKSDFYGFLKPWLGDGLLLSGGSKWQHRRKILTPTFHFNILKQFYVILEENCQRLVQKLENKLGEPVDIVPLISDFTLNSICETAMGTQLSDVRSESGRSYKTAIYKIGKVLFDRFSRIYLYPDILYNMTALKKKEQSCVTTIHNFTRNVINDRKENHTKKRINLIEENDKDEDYDVTNRKKRTAMLDLLLSFEKDGEIDDDGIQEEVDTFMFEGHDTTASGLTFCLMLLANNKHIQDNIITELKEIFGDDKRRPTIDDLNKMRYLERCVKESLRLYPPVHFISRVLSEDVVFSKFTVPAGSFSHVQIYDLHRREDLYENPNAFDPDRFLPENSVGRHPYAYIPFSAGPRNCIGQKFAMMEMKSAVSAVLRKYELLPVTRPSDIVISTDVVLRNDGPVLVKFLGRKN